MTENGHGLDGGVDLSQLVRKPQRAGTGFAGLARHLDEAGTYEPATVVQTPNGAMALPHRTDFVDADQLVELIGDELDKRLRAFAVRFHLVERSE